MADENELNKLINNINRDNLINNLKELIEIKSVNPFNNEIVNGYGEKEIAKYCVKRMEELGMEVQIDNIVENRENVFGVLKSSGEKKSLLFAGHLDTVDADDSAFKAVVKDEKVFGRGACDMKAALAVYLEVARVIVDSKIKLKGDLLIGGVADEEFEMLGSRYVKHNGPKADQCIIGEPTQLKVCPANKGQLCLFVKTFGKSVHSSIPEEGINAIEKMMKVVDKLKEYHNELRLRTPNALCGTASLSVGVIKGGTIASAVPDYCEMEIDRRVVPKETKELIYEELKDILDKIVQEDVDFKYELSNPTFDVAANEISTDEPVVQALLDSYLEYTNEERKVYGLPFGTDAPNMGCPSVVCGPGSISQAHGINEYVEISQLEKAAKMYLSTALKLLI